MGNRDKFGLIPSHVTYYRVNLEFSQGFVTRYKWHHQLPNGVLGKYEDKRYRQENNHRKNEG